MLPYFKFYTEVRKDMKLRSLSPEQRWVWVTLLCYAAEQPKRGMIQGRSKQLVAIEVADGDLDLLITTCEALKALNCLAWKYADSEENTLEIVFLNFERRQAYSKPSNHPARVSARVAKYRERKRSENVTPCNAESNATVTPCNTQVTPCNAIVTPELELIELNSLSLGEESLNKLRPNPAVRTGIDREMLNQAVAVLAGDLRTEYLAQQLNRQHNTAANLLISGLRWFRAANTIQGNAYTEDQRRSWPYFAGIASKIGEAERAAPQPAKRESTSERRRRELNEQLEFVQARDRAEAAAAQEARNGHP